MRHGVAPERLIRESTNNDNDQEENNMTLDKQHPERAEGEAVSSSERMTSKNART